MNHPKGRSGLIRLDPPIDVAKCFAWRSYSEGTGFTGVRLCEELQATLGLLNSYVVVDAHHPWSNRDEPEAFRAIIAELKVIIPLFSKRKKVGVRHRKLWRSYIADLMSLRSRWRPLVLASCHALLSFPTVIWLLLLRTLRGRRDQVNAISFMNYAEMASDPENRVTLSQKLDALGVRIAQINHRLGKRDLESLHGLHVFISRELGQQGYKTVLESSPDSLEAAVVTDACHYMGTTRMGTDPATSVVNPDLRVHSVKNLYIAGGGVFPTSGCVNPTLTIVALSIRLAAHFRSRLPNRVGAPL
jgi:choline dehydrogenase-like flavoprotein